VRKASGYHKVNGLNLYVHRVRDEAVPSSGLTVLLLHGFLDAGSTWDLVAEPLARAGHDVVAPDLRGFGRSDWIGAGGYYYFPDYIADVAALVDALAPARLGVVGHSMGGAVSVYFTGACPGRVERLAILEGLGPAATEPAVAVARMESWLRELRRVDRTPRPLGSLDEAVARIGAHHPRVPRDVLATRAQLLTRVDAEGRLVWAYDPLHRTTSPMMFNIEAFTAFLDRIKCPTLIVSGGPMGWHVPDEAERVAHLARVEQIELPNAGHMVHWSAPGALAERLIAFFGGERGEASSAEGGEAPPKIQRV
jgi:pimeloyl-ACP methyl ester carboxylesterase